MAVKDKHDEEAIVKRVSRGHEEDEHGGAWKVAFADFCLALMCLFLVLWVLAARNQEQLEAVVNSSGGSVVADGNPSLLDHISYPPGSLIPREPVPGQAAEAKAPGKHSAGDTDNGDIHLSKTRFDSAADMQELAQALADMSEAAGLAGNLQTMITPYGLRVMLHDTDKQGMFQRGSAVPSDPFRALLLRIAPVFARIENQLVIVGHTDAAQYHGQGNSGFSNWSLSSSRAMSARANLLQGGLPAGKVLQVVGMAERAPLDSAQPLAAVNRRIELLVLTPAQARLIATMYGMPQQVVPLTRGVDTVAPNGQALQALQQRLQGPAK
ncbi:flagellar motor protein MotB [Vogesella sp. LIG4]|uniref:flagellar motor protein MotB n=1 Tax=Vogesella sp. LIG4 TaxID=1192162 RepID=UPI00081FA4D6|nr:flagellar motor protein MotB [Vogesella sp. LIG4]SCK17560.1 chemotaxis protein MotB [Vogesella sp. LIG4]